MYTFKSMGMIQSTSGQNFYGIRTYLMANKPKEPAKNQNPRHHKGSRWSYSTSKDLIFVANTIGNHLKTITTFLLNLL